MLSPRWCADNEHGKVSPDVINLMKRIFKCGNYETVEDYKKNGGITLQNILEDKWFNEDLPEGALTMRQECIKKTEQRLQSDAYQELERNLRKAGVAVGLEQTNNSMAALSTSEKASA